MEDKNLHDIKIDDLGKEKKTPLKNILTLLALLFIILVISVVITKIILGTDDGKTIENNVTKSELTTESEESNASLSGSSAALLATGAAVAATVPTVRNALIEKNLTSRAKNVTSATKNSLRTATPKKVIKTTTTKEPRKRTHTPKKSYIEPKAHKKSSKSTSKGYLTKLTRGYYIKVGTYKDISTSVSKIKKNGFKYSLIKTKNDKTLTRVLIGPFYSHKGAQNNLAKVKAEISSGAYITKVN